MTDSRKPVTKKVKPYPIEATIEMNGIKKPMQIVFLNFKGVVARMDKSLVHVGEHYNLEFDLPVMRFPIAVKVRVMRTYDKSLNPKLNLVERMAEFHFEQLADAQKSKIEAFLAAIKQEP